MSNTKAQSDPELEQIIEAIKKQPLDKKAALVAIHHYHQQKKELDKQLDQEILQIHLKYDILGAPIFESTNQIINGKIPNEEETELLDEFLTEKEKEQKQELLANNTPIQDYWLNTLLNADVLRNEIQDHDEPILTHLKSIRITNGKKLNFTIHFEFDENPYFKNQVLEKSFIFADDDLDSDNLPIETKGTVIEWKEGKNVTVKIVKKKQKNKKTGQSRTVEKQEDQESFFNFFNTITKEECEKGEKANRLDIDFEIAKEIQEEVLPYSLEYYLGIKKGDEEDEDEDEDDDYSDEEEDSVDRKEKKQKKTHKKSEEEPEKKPQTKEDCKQQ